jgi:signal peptidase I
MSVNKGFQATKPNDGGIIETIKVIVQALLIALVIRTFLFQPFNIPSSSMVPTLQIGDYLFVSKYAYGFSKHSIPGSPSLFSGRILGTEPKRGDVIVFKWPGDQSTDYIKRLIGLPGDHVQVKDNLLYINGKPVKKTQTGNQKGDAGAGLQEEFTYFNEELPEGLNHRLQEKKNYFNVMGRNTPDFVVPPGNYFFMGDNRDNSSDSRFEVPYGVGMVPFENLVGRAEVIFFSIDGSAWKIWEWPWTVRWNRIFNRIH